MPEENKDKINDAFIGVIAFCIGIIIFFRFFKIEPVLTKLSTYISIALIIISLIALYVNKKFKDRKPKVVD